jgi:hypothetical protein
MPRRKGLIQFTGKEPKMATLIINPGYLPQLDFALEVVMLDSSAVAARPAELQKGGINCCPVREICG